MLPLVATTRAPPDGSPPGLRRRGRPSSSLGSAARRAATTSPLHGVADVAGAQRTHRVDAGEEVQQPVESRRPGGGSASTTGGCPALTAATAADAAAEIACSQAGPVPPPDASTTSDGPASRSRCRTTGRPCLADARAETSRRASPGRQGRRSRTSRPAPGTGTERSVAVAAPPSRSRPPAVVTGCTISGRSLGWCGRDQLSKPEGGRGRQPPGRAACARRDAAPAAGTAATPARPAPVRGPRRRRARAPGARAAIASAACRAHRCCAPPPRGRTSHPATTRSGPRCRMSTARNDGREPERGDRQRDQGTRCEREPGVGRGT